jgi:hypothetical protein
LLRRGTLDNLALDLVRGCLNFISVSFVFQTLGNVTLRYYEAVEGFFGASQGRPDSTSFEGGNKSSAKAQYC